MVYLTRIGFALGGYALSGVFLWLFVMAREDVAEQIERCNSEKTEMVQAAVEAARLAQAEGYERRLQEMEDVFVRERMARQIAEEAITIQPERVREVIREVSSESECIDTVVPDVVIDSLRQ